MAKTIRQLTEAELKQFNPARDLSNSLDSERWQVAQARLPHLLAVLRDQFEAERIVVFGSLASKDSFTHWSSGI